jgi:lipopolysaccharide export system protein LptC
MTENNDHSDDKGILGALLQTGNHREDYIETSQRKSKLVRQLKLILPIVSVALVVMLLVWSDQIKIAPPPQKKDILPDQMGQNKLINPRFESQDEKAQPYVITAKEALQIPDNLNVVDLILPKAELKLNDGNAVNVESVKGQFDQVKQTLNLNENVVLVDKQGYQINLQSVDIDLIGKTSQSLTPVTAKGPVGSIQATGFHADSNTGVLTFTGPATLTIQSTQNKD